MSARSTRIVAATGDWLQTLRRDAMRYRFDSEGVSVCYADEGHGAAVVLLHGFAVNADLNWRAPGLIRALRSEFRVIAFDQRGHGASGKPHDPTRYGANLVDDLPRLLDHLGLERCHLVGYSLGGFVALKVATTHPERLMSLSVLGAGWEPPGDGPLARALPALVDALGRGGIGPLSAHLGGDHPQPSAAHSLWVWTMTRLFNDRRALMEVVRSLPALAVSEDELRSLRLPVCSIVGERDPMVVSASAMVERLSDVHSTIIGDADHVSAATRPELREALADFLRSQARP